LSRLIGAYRRSTYRVGTVKLRVERRCPAMDALLRDAGVRAAVLTGAWNPMSQRRPMGWNQRMDARLRERLRRHHWLAGEGGAGGWWEAHVLVLGDPRPALMLARRFRQRAVVVLRRGQKARLIVVK